MIALRDVIHPHVLPRHCPVCAGTGKLGDHRVTTTRAGRVIRARREPCPRCNGTGKPQRRRR